MASDLQKLLVEARSRAGDLRECDMPDVADLVDRLTDVLTDTALKLAGAEGRIQGMVERTNEINRREAERGK